MIKAVKTTNYDNLECSRPGDRGVGKSLMESRNLLIIITS